MNSIKSIPYVSEGSVKWGEPQTNIVRCPKIRDDVHILDHGSVDSVAIWMADADMGTAPGRVTRGAQRKAYWRKQVVG